VIQLGATLAVTLVFRQRVWTLAGGFGAYETHDYALKLAIAARSAQLGG